MWLTSSSIGRKLVMAITGACLILFVTFHCVMNAICICWPTAYNSICEFLGANWYALLASMGLAVLFILHIIYACWLTLQNRSARGKVRYSIEKRPASVEWSSKNMLVLGIVILAFLVVHMIQFWAKMQLQEIRGCVEMIPASAGTLFIQEAFSLVWTPIVYIIGFIALWFHMNHGFWSMFQSAGWTNNVWIPRLKKIGCWWTSLVVLCFIAQAIVFTIQANNNHYKTDERLREQYKEMVSAMWERDFGPDAAQLSAQFLSGDIETTYDRLSAQIPQIKQQEGLTLDEFKQQYSIPPFEQVQSDPGFAMQFPNVKTAAEWDNVIKEQYESQKKSIQRIVALYDFYGYLLDKPGAEAAAPAPAQPAMQAPAAPQQEEVVVDEQSEEIVAEGAADTTPAQPANSNSK